MLSKEVCKKCKRKWTDNDDFRWHKIGFVNCYLTNAEKGYDKELQYASVKKQWPEDTRQIPPDWCPYFLEHIVTEQKSC